MNYLPISCKCVTYGRVSLLEETLHSFLQQDYPGESELIIVNDYPLQKLIFEHPNVKIYNLDKTFASLGEKENFATSMCQHNIIAQSDDDDVYMPNHLKNVNEWFIPGTDLMLWHRGVFYNDPNITAITGLGNAGYVYSKAVWEKLGGYPVENAGHDMSFVMKIRGMSGVNFVQAAPLDTEVSFFYMWGGRGYHASGQGTDTPDRPNIITRHGEHIEYLRQQGVIPTGDVILNPHWDKDYKKMLVDHVNKN